MLSSLQIKDYALIENIHIEFGKGLNIITGETGAGKSILIGALGLLLGNRASTEVVRKGSKKSIVEGIFDVKDNAKIDKLLKENEIEKEPELIVRREVSLKGSNRCFLNDTPVTLALIKEVGDLLVDLHGQHEHQSLLRTETHIEVLDDFGDISGLLNQFREERSKLSKQISNLKYLCEKEETIKEKRELYAFQIKEIDAVNPEQGEEEKLEEELNILENSERLLELTTAIFDTLYEGEHSVYDGLVAVQQQISELAGIDKSFGEKEEECNSALAQIEDIANFVRSYKEQVNLDPDRLNEIRQRLASFNMLKKKYGGTIDKVIAHREKIGAEFDLAENFSGKIEELKAELNQQRKVCGEIAKELSAKRKVIAGEISKEVVKSLTYLGIGDAVFEVKINRTEVDNSTENYIIEGGKNYKYNSRGYDEVEFYISTNLGEDPKPLAKVASGGEVSRIMLSLKTVLAKNDKLPLLIFDEIDTGVSGRIGQKVGHTLKELASYHQIIAITHLPQIAGLADIHFIVEKEKVDSRIVSKIRKLADDDRVREVAKLLSGEEVTEASLSGARELMKPH